MKPTKEYSWKFDRVNSKGKVIFKHYTEEDLKSVIKFLKNKNIDFVVRDGARMLWIYYNTQKYCYYYTTGRWAPWYAGDGYPPKHYNATGIVDFYTRFLLNAKPRLDGLRFSKDDDEALEAIRNLYSQFDNGPGTYMLDDGKEWSYISDGLYMSSDGSFYDDGSR